MPTPAADEAASDVPHVSGGDALAMLQRSGASLLPDPETELRKKARDLASTELERMAAAEVSAGCVQYYKEEQEA